MGERSMAKDNLSLGKFQLTGIPPAPRGVPEIEVTFAVDANGILEVSAEDKGTGKSQSITITADQGRLSEAEIERMVRESQEFEEEDRLVKERVESRNSLESYLYNLKHTLEEKVGDQIDMETRKELEEIVEDALEWLEDNPEATKENLDEKQLEVEQVASPIMRDLYSKDLVIGMMTLMETLTTLNCRSPVKLLRMAKIGRKMLKHVRRKRVGNLSKF